ncbi:cobalamin-binding protein [Micromonospora sp. BRA006-A]|nr:cobalamin-binding protein [Micromonospora sp. BRA006-A]
MGERWARNEWSVAQGTPGHPHQRAGGGGGGRVRRSRPTRGRIVMACMDGEWHARRPARWPRCCGCRAAGRWSSSAPASRPRTWCPTCTAATTRRRWRWPARCRCGCRTPTGWWRRAAAPTSGGGRWPGIRRRRPLGPRARHAVGARRAGRGGLVADERALREAPPAGLDHLADDEYASLVARRGELIDSALADLRERVPSTADYTPAQLDSTISDLGYIVDFLAAALYVDDATLFTGFVEWLVESLVSRGVPAGAVGLTLEHYGQHLRDSRARLPSSTGAALCGRAVGGGLLTGAGAAVAQHHCKCFPVVGARGGPL